MAEVVIESATVITMDAGRRVLEDAAVAIDGDRIVGVGPSAEVRAAHPGARVIDGRRSVVMPGMVDLFAHAGHATLRSLGEGLEGADWRTWLKDVSLRYATDRWWYVEAQLGAAEKLRYGCTAILSAPGFSGGRLGDLEPIRQVHRACEDVGVRTRLLASVGQAPWPQTYATYVDGVRVEKTVTFEEVLDNIEQVISEAAANPSRLVSYSTGQSRVGNPNPKDPMYNPEFDRYLEVQTSRLREIMDRYEVGFYCNGYSNAIKYAYEHDLGILGPRSIISHGTGLDDQSIEILVETGTSISHNPRARRLYLFGEEFRGVEMIDAGVTVGLGSDGPAPDRSGDPFLNVRFAMHHQRERFNSQDVLPPGKALEMSTIDGYRALGLDDVAGSIEVGKKADLIVIDMFKLHLWPYATPVQQVAHFATGEDVTHVFVDGEQVVEDGKLTTIDERALLEEAGEELERMFSEAPLGLPGLAKADPGFGKTRRTPSIVVPDRA